MTKTEPICANCKHEVTEPFAAFQCGRAHDAVTGKRVSCYSERGTQTVTLPRVPAGEPRCGEYGIYFEVRND